MLAYIKILILYVDKLEAFKATEIIIFKVLQILRYNLTNTKYLKNKFSKLLFFINIQATYLSDLNKNLLSAFVIKWF